MFEFGFEFEFEFEFELDFELDFELKFESDFELKLRTPQSISLPFRGLPCVVFFINNIYTWIFENRASKNINSFYFLAISNYETHSKADKKPLSDAGQ